MSSVGTVSPGYESGVKSAPPDGSGYRISTDPVVSCGTCLHFNNGLCSVFNARVSSDMVSDSYEAKPDPDLDEGDIETVVNDPDMQPTYYAFTEDDAAPITDQDVVWKTILRTGHWDYTPDGLTGGAAKLPMDVVLEGTAISDVGIQVGLRDIVAAFEDGAQQHVTIPTSHDNKLLDNTGHIRALEVVDDEDRPGHYKLRAAHDFTEPDIADKVKRRTIANTSSGLLFNYMSKQTGKRYPVVLDHVALTNKPWIQGMEPFGMSEAPDAVVALSTAVADPAKPESPEGDPDPGPPPDSRAQAIWQAVEKAAEDWAVTRNLAVEVLDVGVPKASDHGDQDGTVTLDKAGIRYEATYHLSDDDRVVLDSEDEWTQLGADSAEGGSDLSEPSPPVASAAVEAATPEHQPTHAQTGLAEAQRTREIRFSETTEAADDNPTTTRGGDSMGDTTTTTTPAADDVKDLKLSDEAKALFERQQAEINRLRAEQDQSAAEIRRRNVDDKIKDLEKVGFAEHPGFLAEVRAIMLADDGGPALLLSEEQDGKAVQVNLTATQVLDRVLAALPRKDGRVYLSDQASDPLGLSDDDKPKPNADGEVEIDLDDRVDAAEAYLHGKTKPAKKPEDEKGGDS